LRRQVLRRFPDQVARALRVKRGRRNARVMEFIGPALSTSEARQRLAGYYQDFREAVQAAGQRHGAKAASANAHPEALQ
jgi:cytolysin-activating lysine-acyltransferase